MQTDFTLIFFPSGALVLDEYEDNQRIVNSEIPRQFGTADNVLGFIGKRYQLSEGDRAKVQKFLERKSTEMLTICAPRT
jgi:hypothetical protein